jgi:protein KTI12
VHCDVSPGDAWSWNEGRNEEEGDKYSREVFDALVMRYEAPVGSNRWDAPLLLSLKERPVEMRHVYEAIFERKAPPPNQVINHKSVL